MKKISLLFMTFVFSLATFAQWDWNNSNKTGNLSDKETSEIKWSTKVIDMGVLQYMKPQIATFEFTNQGTQPVIIMDIKGSCGCTKFNYTKAPVLPGKSTKIESTYDSESIGAFDKTITVYLSLNAPNDIHVLRVKGTVENK